MSGEINIVSTTQQIIVQPAAFAMSVINVAMSQAQVNQIIEAVVAGTTVPLLNQPLEGG